MSGSQPDGNKATPGIDKNGMVAIIYVTGVLFPKPNILTDFGFGTALSAIQNQLYEATHDLGISKIIMCFDSPGGSITGINELADTINTLSKPCTAYVQGSAASAAFWLAAACNEIVCDNTSILGSVGVVGTFQKNDNSKIEIVSSHAQDKRPDIESEYGKATILKTLNDLEAVFIASLTKLRPVLTTDKITGLNGGILIGANAVNAGFADGVSSLRNLILGAPINKSPSAITGSQHSGDGTDGWAKAFGGLGSKALNPSIKENPMQSLEEKQAITDDTGWAKAFAKVSE